MESQLDSSGSGSCESATVSSNQRRQSSDQAVFPPYCMIATKDRLDQP